jgi:SAM-dependent methyltransferase
MLEHRSHSEACVIQQSLPEFDPKTPTDARVYACLLGGKDNFAVDRDVADLLLSVADRIDRWRMPAVENRRFMKRAVRFFARAGITQIIDLGCGMPTRANVHDLARVVDEGVKVVYVDHDPVVVTHYRALLHSVPDTAVLQADVRDPARLLAGPEITGLLDLRRPVGVLMAGLFHLIRDEDEPLRIVAEISEAMAPGSLFALSCLTDEGPDPQAVALFREAFKQIREPLALRSRAAIASFFDGLELLEPGLVDAAHWRPDDADLPPSRWLVAGVARRP